MTTTYRYEYRRNGRTIKTRWYPSKEQAKSHMESHIGQFHAPGEVAGDGDSDSDGGHPGCPRNGGLLSVAIRNN